MIKKRALIKSKKGFTIIELMICVFIFAMMTTLLLAKYGSFNTGVLLTNLAYDVALTIRNAQTYGLNVKSAPLDANNFNYAYGVHFALGTEFIFFIDTNSNGLYDANLYEKITSTTIKRGMGIARLCPSSRVCRSLDDEDGNGLTIDWPDSIDVTYKRPNPEAIIKSTNNNIVTTHTSVQSSIALINNINGSVDNPVNTIDIVINKNGAISIDK